MGKCTAAKMDVVTKKSGHQMTGMAVSVCITPAAPSPIPIPYPTMGTVAEGITDPCLRTKIGGAIVMTVGSCMAKCHGNEPGTLKEVVSLNTAGPCFPALGAPNVFMELGMAGITGSIGQMNKSITVGASGSASGAGGGGSGAGAGGGGAGGPGGPGTQSPSGGGGSGGGSSDGAGPPSPPAAPGADGQATAGHPVDVVTGAVFTGPQVDFTLPGFLWLRFTRHYATSAVGRRTSLGWGWSTCLDWEATRRSDRVRLIDPDGREARFPWPLDGEQVELLFGRRAASDGDRLVVLPGDGTELVLARSGSAGTMRLVEMRDREGHRIQIEWRGRAPVRITDSVGRVALLSEHGPLRAWALHGLTSPEGAAHPLHLVSYELDDRERLVRVVDRGGIETSYVYDDEHYLLEEHAADGMIWRFVYDRVRGQKRCVETWGEAADGDILRSLGGDAGSTTARGLFHARLSYGPGPFETTVIDALGHRHRYEGNANGQVTRYLDPLGIAHDYTYDLAGRLIASRDGGGRTSRSYDGLGRLVSVRSPAGSVTGRYDAQGAYHARFPDGSGSTSHYQNDRLTAIVGPAGETTRYDYDAHGRLVKETLPSGAEVTRSYDAHGNLATRTDESGATWHYAFDELGQLVEMTVPTGGSYRLAYDSLGIVADATTPIGATTHYTADLAGRRTAITYPEAGTERWDYAGPAVIAHTRPTGECWRQGFDALLRRAFIENPAGERACFQRDALGRLVEETTFDGRTLRYERDAAGRIVELHRGDRATRLTYDAQGRVVAREHNDGSHELFRYDASGRLVEASTTHARASFVYDDAGRQVEERQEVGGHVFVVRRRYEGTREITEYSSGWEVERRREPLTHRLAGLVVTAFGAEDHVAFAYDADGRERLRWRPDGCGSIETVRDGVGDPVQVIVRGRDEAIVRERRYARRPHGPVLSCEDSRRGTRHYTLDPEGRPLRAQGLGVHERFEYSPHGTPVPADGGWSLGAGGRVQGTEREELGWDRHGRLVERRPRNGSPGWRYHYDASDRLVAAERSDGLVAHYVYDALGRRLAETVGGTTRWFGWDGNVKVDERGGTGGHRVHVYADDRLSPVLEIALGKAPRLIAHDGACTPWLYLDVEGDEAEIELSTWGEVAFQSGSPGPLRFAGQHADAVTGLHYNRHRYYAPDLHVFLTPDPLGLAASPHAIGFVPNPTMFLDPLGLLTIVRMEHGDATVERSIRHLQQHHRGANVVDYRDLESGAARIDGEHEVVVVGHGSPGRVRLTSSFGAGTRVSGTEIGNTLTNAGFQGRQKGAYVALAVCNGASPGAAGIGGTSVAEEVAGTTGATAYGARGHVPPVGPLTGTDYVEDHHLGSPGRKQITVLDGDWVAVDNQGTVTPQTPIATGTTTAGGQTYPTTSYDLP